MSSEPDDGVPIDLASLGDDPYGVRREARGCLITAFVVASIVVFLFLVLIVGLERRNDEMENRQDVPPETLARSSRF